MWLGIASLTGTVAVALFLAWWQGGWDARERKAIVDLVTILNGVEDESLRIKVKAHLESRLRMYVRYARVPLRGMRRAWWTIAAMCVLWTPVLVASFGIRWSRLALQIPITITGGIGAVMLGVGHLRSLREPKDKEPKDKEPKDK